MSVSLETLTLLAPAFAAGAIISLAHVPLGQEVLRRGIIFLDLAVAQFAALGMVAFHVLLTVDEYSYLGMYGPLASGLIAALACAFSFHALENYAGRYQEALIGCAFVLAACLSLLLMANDPHGGEQMKNILEGQILWIDWPDIGFAAPIFITIFLAWSLLKVKRKTLFYPFFALVIPFSVQMIGVYLVFASLIFPALAVANINRFKVASGLVLSMASYALGLWASYTFDWPGGPSIVFSMAIVSLIFAIVVKSLIR